MFLSTLYFIAMKDFRGDRSVPEGFRRVSGRFAEGLRKVCGRFSEGFRKVCGRFAEALIRWFFIPARDLLFGVAFPADAPL